MGCGEECGAKGTIKPAFLSFSKALVKVMPNGVNCLAGASMHMVWVTGEWWLSDVVVMVAC